MTTVLQTFVDAISAGTIYSLLAVSLAVVYRASRGVNFGQGELGALTTFVALSLVGWSVPLVAAILAAAVLGFLACAATYHFVVRRTKAHSESTTILVGTALFLGVNSLAAAVWDTDVHRFPSLFPSGVDDYVSVAGTRVYATVIGNLAVLALVVAGLAVLLRFTPIGLRMRAVASNADSARLAGVAVGSVLAVSWGVAGVIGSIAGALVAPDSSLSTRMMFDVLLYAIAAATLGGLDSIKGAVVGGLAIAQFTGFAAHIPWVGEPLKQATAMVLIVVVLLVRPAGLFGTAHVQRV
jgi:branched-chain amino acid transport system permease protein